MPSAPPQSTLTLRQVLLDLNRNRYPRVEEPSGCKRRAAVALIIRFRPTYPDRPLYDHIFPLDVRQSFEARLETFYSQEWVRNADPEILFIKRTTRAGDRWNGHIAFPGGRQEPDDEDDASTSVRETDEEVGLDLRGSDFLHVGNLPDRLVTTLDHAPLLVLCTNVYLLLRPDSNPLYLQPTEVESAHWVSIQCLQQPELRTLQQCDVSERFSKLRGKVIRYMMRLVAGKMLFTAIRLSPSESVYSAPIGKILAIQLGNNEEGRKPPPWRPYNREKILLPRENPLVLWGLTLGITGDLLELIAPLGLTRLWNMPTLSAWDARFYIGVLNSWKRSSLTSKGPKHMQEQSKQPGSLKGSDTSTFATSFHEPEGGPSPSARGEIPHDHYHNLGRGVVIALIMRSGLIALVLSFLIGRFR